jgi:Fe-S cluster assembly scaffold protein SufB/intein/homing endonuclease
MSDIKPSPINMEISRKLYDKADDHKAKLVAKPGINEEVVELISSTKNEPQWMLDKRLKGLDLFSKCPMPSWGPDLSKLDLNDIVYFVDPDAKEATSWDDVPDEIKQTFDKLGIPEAEKKALAGVGAQYDSGVIYHNLDKMLKEKGVIFENMDTAVHKYPELVKKYFMTSCIPVNDHKFIMLHAAVWSGGTFIYVPKGVKVELPLQAYFRMNEQSGGQFEHTLIIVDEGAELHYIEGCSSPRYNKNSLHAGCVELHLLPGAKMTYSSIENWSRNVYNLNTKRAIVHKDASVRWLNGNMGCLAGDSQVFTNPKGPVNIKDINEGDAVFVWDEKNNKIAKSTVKTKLLNGVKKVYNVEAGGRQVQATKNHPFLTLIRKKNHPDHKKGFFNFEWKPLEKLKVGDVVGLAKKLPINGHAYSLPEFNYNYNVASKNQYKKFTMQAKTLYNQDITVPRETDNDFMWLMGILLGDGFIDIKSNKMNIAIHKTANDLRPELIRVVKKLFNYQIKDVQERYVEIYSKVLADLFINIGFGGDAFTKRIPQWIFGLPEDQILSFLAGYFDSDGHVAKSGTRYQAIVYTSINKPVLDSVKMLAIMCGFGVSRLIKHRSAGKTIILGNECNARDSWRVLLNRSKIHQLPTRSKIKKEKILKIKSTRDFGRSGALNFKSKTNDEIGFARIDTIIPLGEKQTYDIEVEGYHNFITNGLIVHNSHATMLYPCSVLVGNGARSESLGIAFAGENQDQDTGSKVIHAASNTTSIIKAKSISKSGGISSYRGLVKVMPNAQNTKSNVQCDALLLDDQSVSKTYPTMQIKNNKVNIGHEATVSKIGEEQLFYLTSRGLSEEQAMQMIVSGFIAPVIKALPLEYAVELNKLIELEVEGL